MFGRFLYSKCIDFVIISIRKLILTVDAFLTVDLQLLNKIIVWLLYFIQQ